MTIQDAADVIRKWVAYEQSLVEFSALTVDEARAIERNAGAITSSLTALAGAEQQERGRADVLQTFEMNDRKALKEMCRLAERSMQEQDRLKAELEAVRARYGPIETWREAAEINRQAWLKEQLRAEAAEAALAKVREWARLCDGRAKEISSFDAAMVYRECADALAHLPVPSTPHEEEQMQKYRVEIRGSARVWPMVPNEPTEYVVGIQNAEVRLQTDLNRLLYAIRGGDEGDTPDGAIAESRARIAICLAALGVERSL